MLQFLSTLPLGDNRPLQLGVYAGSALALIAVLIIIYRMLFAHRLRLPSGGRARQPRLALVDAFSLDGQRQLVLVRRDNVEHLVMIGGPNDVVIESQIIRASVPAQPAPPRERDSAPAAALPPVAIKPPPSAPQPIPAPVARPAPQPAKPPAPAPAAVAPARVEAAPKAPPPRPAPATAAPLRPVTQAIRPAPLPSPIAPPSPQNQRPPVAVTAPTMVVAPEIKPSAPPIQVASPPLQPVATPVATHAPPPARKEPAPKASEIMPETKDDDFEGLDSLEAEMSRLLGRDN